MLFSRSFDMSDIDALEQFLNVRVTRTRRFIQLDQFVYAQKVLDKFADILGPPQKTMDSKSGERTVGRRQEGRVYLDNLPHCSLLGA